MTHPTMPKRQGLYDPAFEHDACGVGFVCNIDGLRSHSVIERGIQVLENLQHRGAAGSDPETGDGAGMLLQLPHAFLTRAARDAGFRLTEPGDYGVGVLFLPRDSERMARCIEVMEAVVAQEGQRLLGWRDVPVHPEAIGRLARSV